MDDVDPIKDLMFLVDAHFPECKTQEERENKCYELHAKHVIGNSNMRLVKISQTYPFPVTVLVELGKLENENEIRMAAEILYTKDFEASVEHMIKVIKELRNPDVG